MTRLFVCFLLVGWLGGVGCSREGDQPVPVAEQEQTSPAEDADVSIEDTDVAAEDADVPTEDADVPAEDADVPTEDADVSTEDADVPTEDADVPVEDADVPVEGELALAEEAPYWPRFHGPQGDNLSSDTGLLQEWPDDGPPLEWVAEGIGNGYSSVTLAHGLIFTAGNIDGRTVVSALDLDGTLRWQADNGPAWTREYEGTRGTPTIDGERVYHQSPLGNLICLDVRTGERLWTRALLSEFSSEPPTWGLSESVLVDGPHVFSMPGGSETTMVALDKMTGELVWASPSTGDVAGYASPILVEHDGLRILLSMTGKAAIGVDADSGRVLFRDPYQTSYDINAARPIFVDGYAYFTTGYRTVGSRMLRMEVQGENVSVERVWETDDLDNQHGGVLLVDGFLYGAAHQSNNARWICLDWETGKMRWAERGVGRGSLTYADGLLFLYSERRTVGLARASGDQFELISQFRLPPGGTGASWAHPVVCGGRLYLRYDDRLLAYNITSP